RDGDEYNAGGFLDRDGAADVRNRLDDACRSAGRDPASLSLSLMAFVSVGRDASHADARLTSMRAHWDGTQTNGFRVPWEHCHVGSLDDVQRSLRDLESVGVER